MSVEPLKKNLKQIDKKNIKHIDLDYITGCFSPNKDFKEMWGGFAMIQLDPTNTKPALIMGLHQ